MMMQTSSSSPSSSSENRSRVQAIRRAIFDLENSVMRNRSMASVTRSLVSDNASRIKGNYEAAFTGTRQLTNDSTEDLFRTRLAFLNAVEVHTPLQQSYKEALINKTRLEYLELRSRQNEKVLKVSEKMSAVNKELIDVNRFIMDTNEESAQFNRSFLQGNNELFSFDWSKVTPVCVAELNDWSRGKLSEVQRRADSNHERVQHLQDMAGRNRGSISSNSQSIQSSTKSSMEEQRKIQHQQSKVSMWVGGEYGSSSEGNMNSSSTTSGRQRRDGSSSEWPQSSGHHGASGSSSGFFSKL